MLSTKIYVNSSGFVKSVGKKRITRIALYQAQAVQAAVPVTKK